MGGSHHGDSHACRWSLHPRCCLCCWHLQYKSSRHPVDCCAPRAVPSLGIILRLHVLRVCPGVCMPWRCIRHCQVRRGVANMGVLHADMVMKSIIPIIMAGVLGIYGLIVAVLLGSGIDKEPYGYASFSGCSALSAGLCCGMAGLSAGIAIGIVGDAGVRANARQPKLFVGVILIHLRRGSRSVWSHCRTYPFQQHHEVCRHLRVLLLQRLSSDSSANRTRVRFESSVSLVPRACSVKSATAAAAISSGGG